MKPVELKVARIGNSRGVRIPAATLARYEVADAVIMEERIDGILLRAPGPANPKFSWEDTAREMASDAEEWGDWDSTVSDGLEGIQWEPVMPRRTAGRKAGFKPRLRSRKR